MKPSRRFSERVADPITFSYGVDYQPVHLTPTQVRILNLLDNRPFKVIEMAVELKIHYSTAKDAVALLRRMGYVETKNRLIVKIIATAL